MTCLKTWKVLDRSFSPIVAHPDEQWCRICSKLSCNETLALRLVFHWKIAKWPLPIHCRRRQKPAKKIKDSWAYFFQDTVFRALRTAAFTSRVPKLCMIAEPYSTKVGVSPSSALTATLVVTLIFDKSMLPEVHSEMYKHHSAEELCWKRLANWK